MKSIFLASLSASVSLLILSGCGQSDQTSTPSAPPPPQAPAAPSAPQAPAAPPKTTDQAKEVQAAVAQAGAAATQQLMASLKESSDQLLQDIGKDLSAQVQKLKESLASEEGLRKLVDSAVQNLAQSKDAEAVGLSQQLSEAKLTPEQTKLLTEVKNTLSALVVQRNFSSLTGSETEVGKIVSSLRTGDTATALTNLKQVASNASLTPAQKNLLNSLAEQYAPVLKEAGQALQEGLKGINPLQK